MSLQLMLRACFFITLVLACPIFSRPWISPVSAQARKELRVGVAGVPATLEPSAALEGAVPLITRQVFDTLVTFREGSTDVEPALATRWAISKDGLTWTFWLREGVKFHDGAALTAGEVAASFSRGLKLDPAAAQTPWAMLLRGAPGVIKEVRASDSRTVHIVLLQPYAPLLTALAHPALSIARSASLAALAVIPTLSGLSAANGAAQVTHAFRVSLVIAACVAAAAAPLALIGLGAYVRGVRTARRVHCAIDGTPLQPDPVRCPAVATSG